jgi:hypothetical protein
MSEYYMDIEKGISGETLWISNIDPNNVHEHKVKNLNSKHLANIIHFFIHSSVLLHGHSDAESMVIIDGMLNEVRKRELTPEFLQGAPYPYDPTMPYEEYQPPHQGTVGI